MVERVRVSSWLRRAFAATLLLTACVVTSCSAEPVSPSGEAGIDDGAPESDVAERDTVDRGLEPAPQPADGGGVVDVVEGADIAPPVEREGPEAAEVVEAVEVSEPAPREPLSKTLCEEAALTFGEAGATSESEAARFAFLDTELRTMTGSVADLDRDGRVDLLIGERLYLNCGEAGFAELPLPTLDSPALSSSAVMDVNADGRPDIVYGDVEGRVWILLQNDEGLFDAQAPTLVAEGAMIVQLALFPDKDGDGRPDYLYAATRAFPPKGFIFGATSVPSEAYADNQAENVLLSLSDSETLTPVPLPTDVADCGRSPAFAAQMATRHHLGLADTLYISATWSADCAFPLAPESGAPTEPIHMPGGASSYTKMNWSMGVDHTYTDQGVVFAVSDVGVVMTGRPRVNLWVLGDDDVIRPMEGQEANVPPAPPAKIGWGVHFADFNLDGPTDLLFAYGQPGVIGRLDEEGEPVINWPPSPSAPGGVELFEGDSEGTMVEVADAAPTEQSGRSSFGLFVGDFYGEDGAGDGCLDVMVTPLFLPRCLPGTPECDAEEEIPVALAFANSVSLLRNRCADAGAKRFVGVRALARDTGAVARLVLEGGETIVRPIRASAGTSGTSETSVVFALPGEVEVESFDVLHPDGSTRAVEPAEGGFEGWLSL